MDNGPKKQKRGVSEMDNFSVPDDVSIEFEEGESKRRLLRVKISDN